MVRIMKIPVGVSARHIHLTKNSYIKLFGDDNITKKRNINQPDLFLAEQRVTLKGNKEINNVAILGPFRDYDQVEISKTDAYELGVNPSIRDSGDINGTPLITIVGPKGSISAPIIIATRHIHISRDEANKLNIKDKDPVAVKITTNKPGVILAKYKVSERAYLELHLDLDDANAFMLNQDDEVEIIN